LPLIWNVLWFSVFLAPTCVIPPRFGLWCPSLLLSTTTKRHYRWFRVLLILPTTFTFTDRHVCVLWLRALPPPRLLRLRGCAGYRLVAFYPFVQFARSFRSGLCHSPSSCVLDWFSSTKHRGLPRVLWFGLATFGLPGLKAFYHTRSGCAHSAAGTLRAAHSFRLVILDSAFALVAHVRSTPLPAFRSPPSRRLPVANFFHWSGYACASTFDSFPRSFRSVCTEQTFHIAVCLWSLVRCDTLPPCCLLRVAAPHVYCVLLCVCVLATPHRAFSFAAFRTPFAVSLRMRLRLFCRFTHMHFSFYVIYHASAAFRFHRCTTGFCVTSLLRLDQLRSRFLLILTTPPHRSALRSTHRSFHAHSFCVCADKTSRNLRLVPRTVPPS